MKKLKPILQKGTSDCGSACIATILAYYGKTVPVEKISEAAGTDRIGTSGVGIVKACETFGLSCSGIMITDKDKLSAFTLPAICHFAWKNQEHYVVIYRISKRQVWYHDPAVGLTTDTIESFLSKWSGVVFLVHPNSYFEKGNARQGVFSRFLVLLKPYKKYLVETVIASFFISLFGIILSLYFRFLIDEVLYSQVSSTLTICSLCYLIIISMQILLSFCRSQILSYLGAKIDVCLVSDFYLHLLKLPLDFFSKRKTGEILSRLHDTNIIQNAISSTLLSIAMDCVMIFIGAFFMLKMGSILFPISMIPVLLSSLVVFIFKSPFKKNIQDHAILEAEKNASIYETINGISTIKGLATEEKAFHRSELRIVEAASKKLELIKLGNIQNSLQSFISSCGTLALYWVGSILIFNNQITLGQLISFTTLSGYYIGPLSRLLTMQSYWQEVFVSAERLSSILDTDEEETSGHKEDIERISGDIVFKNVCFSYGTRGRTLKDISFSIPYGKKVAFVGMSGSGKSTLLKLLMKFYQCESGTILINGKNIDELANDSYRNLIGYVPQESLLFSGTISENIAWGTHGAKYNEMINAASDAQALSFINQLPDKFNTFVGEQGATLSGGERQRIALARILMRNPDVIILDEATASLDSISEQKIMDAIYQNIKEKTVIMVAHRLSTIKNCDHIFVLDHGELIEQGTHQELLKYNQKYAQMWRAQHEKNSCSETSE